MNEEQKEKPPFPGLDRLHIDEVRIILSRIALRCFPVLLDELSDTLEYKSYPTTKQDPILVAFLFCYLNWVFFYYRNIRLNPLLEIIIRKYSTFEFSLENQYLEVTHIPYRVIVKSTYSLIENRKEEIIDTINQIISYLHPSHVEDVVASIREDILLLDSKGGDINLMNQPLWLNYFISDTNYRTNIPSWIRGPLDQFIRSQIGSRPHFQTWIKWYRGIIPNHTGNPTSPWGEKADLRIVTLPESFWSQNWESISLQINDIISDVILKGGNFQHGDETDAKKILKAPRKLRESVDTHSDEPTLNDRLGRRPFARALVERIDDALEKGGEQGFAVHLHAPWGAGKTSIIMMMSEIMANPENRDDRWATVHFNAWENERRDPPWWALIKAAKVGCIDAANRFVMLPNARKIKWHWFWWRFLADWLPLALAGILAITVLIYFFWLGFGGASGKGQSVLSFFSSPKLAEKGLLDYLLMAAKTGAPLAAIGLALITAMRWVVFGSTSNAKYYFDLSHDPLGRVSKLFGRLVKFTGLPVCIFIDDLDRCNRDYVVKLLEGIQTSFRNSKVVYVVAADRHWIRSAFDQYYEGFSTHVGSAGQPLGYLFLEKVFQISTPIPGMDKTIRSQFWKGLHTRRKTPQGSTEDAENPLVLTGSLDDYDKEVKGKRDTLRETYGEDITRENVDDYLEENTSPADRAAAVLALNASREADTETEHLLKGFEDFVPDNPRVMKRMVNAFAMHQSIELIENGDTPSRAIARWTILEQADPALADILMSNPDLVDEVPWGNVKPEEVEKLDEAIRPFVGQNRIKKILKDGEDPLTVEHIRKIARRSIS